METSLASSWAFWALLSAMFAAMTAIFAKVGVEGVDSDIATFIRTIVILFTLGFILFALGKFHSPGALSTKTWVFLVLSGLATGASWICYFRALKVGPASLVAPVDAQCHPRRDLRRAAAWRAAGSAPVDRGPAGGERRDPAGVEWLNHQDLLLSTPGSSPRHARIFSSAETAKPRREGRGFGGGGGEI